MKISLLKRGIKMSAEAPKSPKDITWERLAFSPDMFDTNFGDPSTPPKWRSSLAAFYYTVPEDETKENYPDRRIMYLRVMASITGCNFTSEGLVADEFVVEKLKELLDKNVLNNYQTSILQTITGKLSYYYPCSGTILQVAVFPHKSEKNVSLEDFPYVQDFEPKKRELYETVNRSGEVLAGSSEKLNLTKGTTTAESTEESDILTGVSVKVGGWGVSAETEIEGKWGTERTSETEQSETRTTDTSMERKETQSFTTTINQMYQPLLSYHLGTNRALWTISPRPNTVDSEFNLIDVSRARSDGETAVGRKLEGIQDMLLVVNLPKNRKGLCLQVTLDTGFDVYDAGIDSLYFLVVMRRILQACGKFDIEGKFKPDPPGLKMNILKETLKKDYIGIPVAVNEFQVAKQESIDVKYLGSPSKKQDFVQEANIHSKYVMRKMLDGFSSRRYKPRHFVETEAFKTVVKNCLEESDYQLEKMKVFSGAEMAVLNRLRIKTVGDLVKAMPQIRDEDILKGAKRILDMSGAIGQKIIEYERGKTIK